MDVVRPEAELLPEERLVDIGSWLLLEEEEVRTIDEVLPCKVVP